MKAEREALEHKLDALANSEAQSEAAMRAMIQEVVKYSELLKNVTELYNLAKTSEKEAIVQKICSELLLDQNSAQLSPKIGLEPIFQLKNLLCEETDWYSELFTQNKN